VKSGGRSVPRNRNRTNQGSAKGRVTYNTWLATATTLTLFQEKLAKKLAKTGKTIMNMKFKSIGKCAKVARATNFVDAATSSTARLQSLTAYTRANTSSKHSQLDPTARRVSVSGWHNDPKLDSTKSHRKNK